MPVDGHIGDDAVVNQGVRGHLTQQRQHPLVLSTFVPEPVILGHGVVQNIAMARQRDPNVGDAE